MKLIWDLSDLVAKRVVTELMNSPRAMAVAMSAVQRGLELKGQLDRTLAATFAFLGIPTVTDVRRIARKLDVVQGSIDNVSARLDQALKRKTPRRRKASGPRRRPASNEVPGSDR